MKLFIVESPAKAKTIQSYLGGEYKVLATMGHIKDLPQDRMGFDKDTFEPEYRFLQGKKKIADTIKEISKSSEEVILASDKDREGEIISFHVKDYIKNHASVIKRIEFDEVTKEGILKALSKPRDIDLNLVNAQKVRRLLDRIIGYILSPEAKRYIKRKETISVGRVQSPALRIICDREEEIRNFKPQSYFDFYILCHKDGKEFKLKLISEDLNGRKIFFGPQNRIDLNKKLEIEENINKDNIFVVNVTSKEEYIDPLPPFKTSTLQQDASAKLGFSPSKTMKLAQELYEGMQVDNEFIGLITYMRTDSVRISDYAMNQVRDFISRYYPNDLPDHPRYYANKSQSQDAHECIRPTNTFRTPELLKGKIPVEHWKLYEIIWRRFVASQMKSAMLSVLKVEASDGKYTFSEVSKSIKEKHFLKMYPHSVPDDIFIPYLSEGEKLNVKEIIIEEKKTQPPPRYTEATLIKKLEDEGIGRPSTYATIISTLLNRKYVEKKNKSLLPTDLGFEVYNFLKNSPYNKVIDLKFTSFMEKVLDDIESGKEKNWRKILMYFIKEVNITYEMIRKKFDYENTFAKKQYKSN